MPATIQLQNKRKKRTLSQSPKKERCQKPNFMQHQKKKAELCLLLPSTFLAPQFLLPPQNITNPQQILLSAPKEALVDKHGNEQLWWHTGTLKEKWPTLSKSGLQRPRLLPPCEGARPSYVVATGQSFTMTSPICTRKKSWKATPSAVMMMLPRPFQKHRLCCDSQTSIFFFSLYYYIIFC